MPTTILRGKVVALKPSTGLSFKAQSAQRSGEPTGEGAERGGGGTLIRERSLEVTLLRLGQDLDSELGKAQILEHGFVTRP